MAQNAKKLRVDVDPVIEASVSLKLRISCVDDKYRPKKDSLELVDSHVIQFQ